MTEHPVYQLSLTLAFGASSHNAHVAVTLTTGYFTVFGYFGPGTKSGPELYTNESAWQEQRAITPTTCGCGGGGGGEANLRYKIVKVKPAQPFFTRQLSKFSTYFFYILHPIYFPGHRENKY